MLSPKLNRNFLSSSQFYFPCKICLLQYYYESKLKLVKSCCQISVNLKCCVKTYINSKVFLNVINCEICLTVKEDIDRLFIIYLHSELLHENKFTSYFWVFIYKLLIVLYQYVIFTNDFGKYTCSWL